jgi:hypothetical protein
VDANAGGSMAGSALSDLSSHPSCLLPADRGEGEHQLRRVEGLAEAHTGYPQLFDLADILGDRCGWMDGWLGCWGLNQRAGHFISRLGLEFVFWDTPCSC